IPPAFTLPITCVGDLLQKGSNGSDWGGLGLSVVVGFAADPGLGDLFSGFGTEFCNSAATEGATGFWLLAVSLGVLRAEFCNSAATGRATGFWLLAGRWRRQTGSKSAR